MPKKTSCAAVVAHGRPRWLFAAAMATVALLGACSTAPDPAASGPAAQARAERPPSPPKEALAFDEAVTALTVALLARAQPALPATTSPRPLVVDPLIDRSTGNQAAATRSMEGRMVSVMRERFPQVEPRPFTLRELDRQPLVLVGSITTVAGPGVIPTSTDGPVRTYRIWAAIADLRTGKIVSHETAWVRPDGVDMTPTPFFRDSPVWLVDPIRAAYIKVCASDPPQEIDATYVTALKASAAVADGIKAYEGGHYQEALTHYTAAQQLPSGDQLRVLNGLYLTNLALGRGHAAEEAFGRLVDAGLRRGTLAVKLVFRPASVQFWPDPAVSGQYPVWLRQIAQRSAARDTCLLVVGHTSPTGTPAANEALSERRAAVVRSQLVRRVPALEDRTEARGRGSREPLIGTGRDDASDVLDRRVEFEPRPCTTLRAERAPGRV